MHTRRVSLCEFRTLPDNTEGLAMAAEIGRGTPRRAVVEPRLEEEEVRILQMEQIRVTMLQHTMRTKQIQQMVDG